MLNAIAFKLSNYHWRLQNAKARISTFLFIWITNSSNAIQNIELWRIIGKDQNGPMKFNASIALIDGYWLVNNDWLADINWPDHLTCSSYSVKRKTPKPSLIRTQTSHTQQHLQPFIGGNELKCVIFFMNKSWLN